MSEPIAWYEFDSESAKGKLGVRHCAYGLEIVCNKHGEVKPVCMIDLWTFTDEGKISAKDKGMPPHIMVVIDDTNTDDSVAFAHCLPEGTRVEFEVGVEQLNRKGTVRGAVPHDALFGYTPGGIEDESDNAN